MEESGLDDFFAKKDKSKKKSKNKVTVSDILAKQEQVPEDEKPKPKKIVKKKKDKEKPTQKNSTEPKKEGEGDEEWVDYEEKSEVDYTGLRIQNLQITAAKEDEDGQEKEGGSDGEDGEGGERREGSQGPWQKIQAEAAAAAAAAAEAAPEPEPQPEPVKEVAPVRSGKYVPPGARSGDSSGGPSISRAALNRKKKIAPNLQSQSDFPTLGGGPGDSADGYNAPTQAQFEVVRSGGGRHAEDPRVQKTKVEIGNKYDALTGEDS